MTAAADGVSRALAVLVDALDFPENGIERLLQLEKEAVTLRGLQFLQLTDHARFGVGI
jgi:hypothetical protein